MELNKPAVDLLARRLYEAKLNSLTVQTDPTESLDLSVDQSYQVQHRLLELKAASGDVHVGYKIALTNSAARGSMGVDFPVYGHLTLADLLPSGARIALQAANQPMVEPELAFKLIADPFDCRSSEELLSTVLVAPGIEIADSRYETWPSALGLNELICDAAAAHLAVFGEPVRVRDLWSSIPRIDLECNGSVVHGHLENVMATGPLEALAWLVSELRARDLDLPLGSIVFAGSVATPLPAIEGTFRARFGSIGSVEVSFS